MSTLCLRIGIVTSGFARNHRKRGDYISLIAACVTAAKSRNMHQRKSEGEHGTYIQVQDIEDEVDSLI